MTTDFDEAKFIAENAGAFEGPPNARAWRSRGRFTCGACKCVIHNELRLDVELLKLGIDVNFERARVGEDARSSHKKFCGRAQTGEGAK